MPRDLIPKSRNIVVMGGSAGALAAMQGILADLRPDFPAAVFAVQHVGRRPTDTLLRLLEARSSLPVAAARDGERIRSGAARVCESDRHMVLERDRVLLTRGPTENHCRPAIDPLFRSAAACHQGRVIAVLLSGYLSDGVAGLGAVRRCGGLTIVQDPGDAAVGDMPENALRYHQPDYVGSAARIADLMNQLAGQPAPDDKEVPRDILLEVEMATGRRLSIDVENTLGRPSPYACPDCNGNLWQVGDGIRRYRCHVGHAFTADALGEAQATKLDEALWSALRAMRERVRLLRQLAEDARAAGHGGSAHGFEDSAHDVEAQAETLQKFILNRPEAHKPAELDDVAHTRR